MRMWLPSDAPKALKRAVESQYPEFRKILKCFACTSHLEVVEDEQVSRSEPRAAPYVRPRPPPTEMSFVCR